MKGTYEVELEIVFLTTTKANFDSISAPYFNASPLANLEESGGSSTKASYSNQLASRSLTLSVKDGEGRPLGDKDITLEGTDGEEKIIFTKRHQQSGRGWDRGYFFGVNLGRVKLLFKNAPGKDYYLSIKASDSTHYHFHSYLEYSLLRKEGIYFVRSTDTKEYGGGRRFTSRDEGYEPEGVEGRDWYLFDLGGVETNGAAGAAINAASSSGSQGTVSASVNRDHVRGLGFNLDSVRVIRGVKVTAELAEEGDASRKSELEALYGGKIYEAEQAKVKGFLFIGRNKKGFTGEGYVNMGSKIFFDGRRVRI